MRKRDTVCVCEIERRRESKTKAGCVGGYVGVIERGRLQSPQIEPHL